MTNKEIRMRCIEALSSFGVREPQRLIKEAAQLEVWVHKAEEDKVETPPKRGRKPQPSADKEQSPA